VPSLESLETKQESSTAGPSEQQAVCSGYEFATHHFETMATSISEFEIRWLMKRGVSEDALWNPWPVGATTENGIRYLTFVAFNGDTPIDIVAWQPRTGDLFAYSGRATFLGNLEDVMNAAIYMADGYLTIHADPLEWLRAGRAGVVIVNERLASAYLRDRPRVFCPDPETAKAVKRAVRSPKSIVKILTTRGSKELAKNVY
jgi:hypothetical protein